LIEWGTWEKSGREKLRDEAQSIGAKVKFYYLDIKREILKERILKRNESIDEYDFYIQQTEIDSFLDHCFNSFQAPTEDELITYDYIE
jgi:gluconate kinase